MGSRCRVRRKTITHNGFVCGTAAQRYSATQAKERLLSTFHNCILHHPNNLLLGGVYVRLPLSRKRRNQNRCVPREAGDDTLFADAVHTILLHPHFVWWIHRTMAVINCSCSSKLSDRKRKANSGCFVPPSNRLPLMASKTMGLILLVGLVPVR